MRSRTNPITQDFTPIGGINTTPLIDVMLVLLVMFIIIMPAATHKVPLDLPGEGEATVGPPPPVHLIALDAAGALSWDGATITPAALPAKLAALQADPAKPVLHMKADAETPYVRFDETLSTIKKAGVSRLGFVGNEAFVHAID